MQKLTLSRDQEIRFTVHDSPDYYQLKVSVFNDDKKTELIGETWIALEQIVVPGGGQNDVWHTLTCKGRYAGEIRIELTYYDTRPREERVEKRRQSAPMDVPIAQASSGVGGPREPKPIKRRPLPADPTDPSRSSPLPHTPVNNQQQYAESPDHYGIEPTGQDRRHERFHNGTPQGSPLGHSQQQQRQINAPQDSNIAIRSMDRRPSPTRYEEFVPADTRTHRQEPECFNNISQDAYPYEEPVSYQQIYHEHLQSRPMTQPLQNTQGMIHAHSSPAIFDARPCQSQTQGNGYPGSSLTMGHTYDEPIRDHYLANGDYHEQMNDYPAPVLDQAPPPPPVHRNSGSGSTSQPRGRLPGEQHAPIPATAPLNVRGGRGSFNGSPLSQVHSDFSNSRYAPSTSPSTAQSYSQHAPSVSSHTSYSQLRKQRSQSPIRDYGESVPPSLVPGYEPSIAEDESERIMYEKRMSVQHRHSEPPQPQYQQLPTSMDSHQPQYQQAPSPIAPSPARYQQGSSPMPQSIPRPRPRNIDSAQDRRTHRASAPIIQPQISNANLRTPVRKSVSPQPDSAPATRRTSEVPFSPDSFNAFNPSISAAESVNEPGARYNTPEQAREATRQHERQEKLGDGPIIGSDGRIIDPSDHLPTDTWAPEPEQKTPKKGPQVTMRFRNSPQGAQPMPAARRPNMEHSASTPIYAHGPSNPSPNTATRNRLQKKSGAAAGQPASSPLVPTLNTTPRSSPLRERENYGGYGSSPTYGGPSPSSVPPPIPGKVPIGAGQEDWDTSALSEEMKRIDIGVGGGRQGRQRRSRYGF